MARSKRVGYAVVGMGFIAETSVLPAFRESAKGKLVALVSHDLKRARQMGAKFGVKDCYSYEDYDQCLNHPEVDAVFIASINGEHAEQTMRAAAACQPSRPLSGSVMRHRSIFVCTMNMLSM